MLKRVLFILGLLILACMVMGAPQAFSDDEPTPGVARVSVLHGDVSTQRGDSGDSVAATVNAPVVRGDQVSTGARSRTELQLDYANILRLDQQSAVKIADLTRTRIQLQLSQGLMEFTVLKGSEADVEIDTPNMAVHPLGEGMYRIQVNSAADTELTVRKGQAEVSTPQGSTTVEKNQVIYVKGTDTPEYQVAKAEPKDEFDDWARDRDGAINDAQSYRYANRYYTGANDLDRYGHWTQVPDYDWCWTPYVNAGWVPYRDGRWVWEPYYGWTWVSYEPWGWAPYHYGRWFWYGNSWSWWPGATSYGYYPTWGPAYVSFLGFGFGGRNWGFGFGYGFNNIGWCPLGPRDSFHPWWGGRNSYNVVNITNVTNINNINNINSRRTIRTMGNTYTGSNLQAALNNPNVRRGITTASAQDFMNGRVPRNPRAIDAGVLRQAQVVQGTLPVSPTRNALQPAGRAASTHTIPRQVASNPRFFTKSPAPAGPEQFNQRQNQIQQMMSRYNPMQAGGANNPAARAGGVATTNANVQANPAASGRMGTPAAPTAQREPFSNANRPGTAGSAASTTTQPGWRRFGAPATGAAVGGEVAQNARPATPNRPAPSATTSARPAPANPQAPRPVTPSASSRGGDSSGWHRFGGSRATPAPSGGRASEAAPRSQSAPSGVQARPVTPPSSGSSGGWNRFERSAPAGAASSAPRSQSAPSGVQARPVTPPSGGSSGGWNRFERSAPSSGRSYSAPRSSEGRSYGGESRGYERAPLNLQRPIVTERPAPRSSGGWGGGGGGRTYSAPAAPRSYGGGGGGGGRSYSAPAAPRSSGGGGGGGRSAPAPRGGGESRGRH